MKSHSTEPSCSTLVLRWGSFLISWHHLMLRIIAVCVERKLSVPGVSRHRSNAAPTGQHLRLHEPSEAHELKLGLVSLQFALLRIVWRCRCTSRWSVRPHKWLFEFVPRMGRRGRWLLCAPCPQELPNHSIPSQHCSIHHAKAQQGAAESRALTLLEERISPIWHRRAQLSRVPRGRRSPQHALHQHSGRDLNRFDAQISKTSQLNRTNSNICDLTFNANAQFDGEENSKISSLGGIPPTTQLGNEWNNKLLEPYQPQFGKNKNLL